MNERTLFGAAIGALVAALLLGFVAISNMDAAAAWESCYNDAIELAEDSIDTNQEFADSVIGDLSSILLGGNFNEARLDRLGQEMSDNIENFEELEERC